MSNQVSETAKKVAGTFVPDQPEPEDALLRWLQNQCRTGVLSEAVRTFVHEQEELIDPALVLVESVTKDELHCSIPCRLCDHESAGTFLSSVRFTLNPATGQALRRVEV